MVFKRINWNLWWGVLLKYKSLVIIWCLVMFLVCKDIVMLLICLEYDCWDMIVIGKVNNKKIR